tara:strand:- start:579 stop:860 length:282 start_codon:yes stop_codon:yes gene_type:complete
MNNPLFKGTLIGLIAPVAAFIVYVAFFTNNSDPIGMFYKLISMNKLTHVISLSVLINLLLFFMKIKINNDDQARGILLATFIYAIVIVILKFI